MKIYNSLSRQIEDFVPLNPPHVGMYTCGPTVYSFATIGNLRTYSASDLLLRVLRFNGYSVEFVMNLTDVGHLTGDNQGDADTGEDRLEKSAQKEGKTAYEVAQIYTEAFLKDFSTLNYLQPKLFAKATDHIPEQIDLVKRLEEKGLVYKTSDGVYFDTEKYENQTHKQYGELSNLDKILEGARVEPNPEKRNARDFAVWKFSYAGGRAFDSAKDDQKLARQMEWESPWGLGFPGWHIECSAMSMKYLGETFDIHTGGEDLRATHHPNEIAQSEGATGKLFVKYWLHSAFLKVDGKRMGKSLGNAYTVKDIVEKGYDPLALRYFYLTGHYRSPMNFTWEGLSSAAAALSKLQGLVRSLESDKTEERSELSAEKMEKITAYREQFTEAISDDLNTPQALAVVWEAAKSNIPNRDKKDLLLLFDEVLGLQLDMVKPSESVPADVQELFEKRQQARAAKDYSQSDSLRDQLMERGYTVLDGTSGESVLSKIAVPLKG